MATTYLLNLITYLYKDILKYVRTGWTVGWAAGLPLLKLKIKKYHDSCFRYVTF